MEKLRILEDCKKLMWVVFELVKRHPEYKFNINDQLIRSTLSIGSNLAEGNQRKGRDRNHFFDMALGSLEESRFQIECYPDGELDIQVSDCYDKIRATIIRLKSSS